MAESVVCWTNPVTGVTRRRVFGVREEVEAYVRGRERKYGPARGHVRPTVEALDKSVGREAGTATADDRREPTSTRAADLATRIGGPGSPGPQGPRRKRDHGDEPDMPCNYCDGYGDICNPGNADPNVKVVDWLHPVNCPRCGATGKEPNHG